jgi:hypothetical protein
MSDYEECDCGRGRFDANEYSSCYQCFLDRRDAYVVCILCGVRWHSPDYGLCFSCGGGLAGRAAREEAARALRTYVMWRDGYRCRHCGGRAEQIDHIKPCARGGRPHRWNLQALCAQCNRDKGAAFWDEDELDRRELIAAYFYDWRGLLTVDERAALKWDVEGLRIAVGNRTPVLSLGKTVP